MTVGEYRSVSLHTTDDRTRSTRIATFFRRVVSAYVAHYEPYAQRAGTVDVSTLLRVSSTI